MKANDLRQKGLHLIVSGFVASLQADARRQLQALKALQDLYKSPGVPLPSVQAAFRDSKGFPSLVGVIGAVVIDTAPQNSLKPCLSSQESSTFSLPRRRSSLDVRKQNWLSTDGELCAVATLAASVLAELVRNNPLNRQAALQAGALSALCNVLVSGGEEPLAVEILRTLYLFIRADTSGYLMSELMEAGIVNTLVAILKCAFQLSSVSNSDVWAQESLSILSILAKRSKEVAQCLVDNLATITQLMNVCQQPITLSLGLDILEELILTSDSPSFAQELLMQGGLRALVRVMHIHGLGSQVVLLFARLMCEAMFRNALHAVMSPQDVACLFQVALHAADAKDLDSTACRQLITLLLEVDAVGMVVKCTQGRCMAAALTLPSVLESITEKASNPLVVSVITNLGNAYSAEAAMASAVMLPYCQMYLPILMQQDYMISLVCAALNENEEVATVTSLGCPSTTALLSLLAFMQPRLPHQNASQGDLSRSSSSALTPSQSNSSFRSSNNGDAQKYESVRFVVGGREFFALSWLLESFSPVIASIMTPLSPNSKFHTVHVPSTPGLSPNRQYEIFGLAVEYLYTSGNVEPMDADLLDLWALATSLQIGNIKEYCETQLRRRPLLDDTYAMHMALCIAACMEQQGDTLQHIVVDHVINWLPQLVGTAAFGRLICKQRRMLEEGLVGSLIDKLKQAALYKEPVESGSSRPVGSELLVTQRSGWQSEMSSGTISAENAVEWSNQLSSVFSKKLPPIKTQTSSASTVSNRPSVNGELKHTNRHMEDTNHVNNT